MRLPDELREGTRTRIARLWLLGVVLIVGFLLGRLPAELDSGLVHVLLDLGVVVALMAFTLVGWSRVVRPLERVAAATRSFVPGSDAPTLPVDAAGEVGELARAIAWSWSELSARAEAIEEAAEGRGRVEEQLRMLIDVMPAGVLFCDREGIVRFANLAAAVAFDRELLEGVVVEELLPPSMGDRHRELRAAYFSSATQRPIGDGRVFELQRGSGERFFAELGLVPAEYDGRALVLVHDVTARHLAEKDRRSRERQESLQEIAVGVAHDANNALASLRGGLELLEHEILEHEVREAALRPLALASADATAPARLRHDTEPLFTDVYAAARRLEEMGNVLLTYSGTAHRRPECVEVVAALAEIGADPQVEVAPGDDHASVWFDPRHLVRLVERLVANGKDASPAEGVVRLAIDTADSSEFERHPHRWGVLDPEPRYVRITVSDDGVGMSPDVARRACDPLYTTKPGHQGFGLATALGIVRSSDGALAIDTAPGAGTRVSVFVRLSLGTSESVPRTRVSLPAPRSDVALVIDDDPLVRRSTRLLARQGKQVLDAEDGPEGLACLADHPEVGLVVLDMRMPKMAGAEVLAAIRERRPSLPVLLVSGQTDAATSELVDEYPNVAFLPKPFGRKELAERIGELDESSS